MVNIVLYKKDGLYFKYEALGHANYDVYGKDIVCAGISAIAQTIMMGLDEISSINYDLSGGRIEVIVHGEDIAREGVQALFKAFELGIKAVENDYPEYVKLETINKTP